MAKDAEPPVNPFAAHQHVLRERLYYFLATLHSTLYADVEQALEGEGKLLSPSPTDLNHSDSQSPALLSGVWPLLTLLVAQSISPGIDPLLAGSVALAVECYVCAIDLLDDVMDEDQTKTLQESALVVAAGQHRDLLAEQRPLQEFTREECIEIAAAKAGSIMRLACRLGALCAGADDALCEQFSELGELLGIAHQLDNDSHDLYYLLQGNTSSLAPTETETSTGHVKSDLARGKKTLPIVLGAQVFNVALKRPSLQADQEKEEYLRSLHEGIITTWGICLLYRERARDRLQEIEARKPIVPTLRLLLGFE